MGKLRMMGPNVFHVSPAYHELYGESYRRIAKLVRQRLNQRPESYVIDQLHRMALDGDYTLTCLMGSTVHTYRLAAFLPQRPPPGMPGAYIRVVYGQFATGLLTQAQWAYEANVADKVADAVMEPISIAHVVRRNAAVVAAGVILFGQLLKPGVQLKAA